jgi:hypothetical protein
MKKLLLLIVPALLFFGVSFADTFDFSTANIGATRTKQSLNSR